MNMKRNLTYYLLLLGLVLFILNPGNLYAELTAKQIMDKTFDSTKLSGSESISTLKIIDSRGNERIRQISMATKLYDNGQTEKKIIRFKAPADVKGTGLLTYDYKKKKDDMWLFMPELRITKRIISSEKAKSFMGSEFSYADMTPPILDEFNYKKLGSEAVNDNDCWKIEMIPVNEDIADEYGFSKRIVYTLKKNFVMQKIIYYDLDGELHKELNIHKVKLLDAKNNKYRLMHMTMNNILDGRKSIMITEKAIFNPAVKDEYFTVRYLERF